MDKAELKAKLLQECIKIQTEHLQTLKNEIDETEQIANEDDGGAEENMNSFREEMQNKREVFTRQFMVGSNDLQLLNRLDGNRKDSVVQLGSVVITENQNLYISVSLGKFSFDGKEYFAISNQTPLFKAIAGKKKGESGILNGKEVKIVDIF